MSGIRPEALRQFYALLRDRDESSDTLAAELDVSGGNVRRLIGNLRPRRGPVWKGLLALLTEQEKALLFSVEQCPTWNARQLAKRPVFTPEKAAEISAARERRNEVQAVA